MLARMQSPLWEVDDKGDAVEYVINLNEDFTTNDGPLWAQSRHALEEKIAALGEEI